MAVSLAIKSGRLSKSVARDANGQPKISDPDLADREWAANTDYTDAPYAVVQRAVDYKSVASERQEPPPDHANEPTANMTVSEAGASYNYWKAKNEQLKFRQAANELIEATTVQRGMAERASRIKTKLLGLPAKLKQALPELSLEQLAQVDRLLREALEELADGK